MQNIFDKEKLEQILVLRWTEFINVRKLMEFAKESLAKYLLLENCKIIELRVSRFEPQPTSCGFLLWLDVILVNLGKKIKATIEVLLSLDGTINYIGHEAS